MKKIVFLSFVAALGDILFGYDTAVIPAAVAAEAGCGVKTVPLLSDECRWGGTAGDGTRIPFDAKSDYVTVEVPPGRLSYFTKEKNR